MPAGFESFIEGTSISQIFNTHTYFRLIASGVVPNSGWIPPVTPITGIGAGNPTYNYMRKFHDVPQLNGATNVSVVFHTPVGAASVTHSVNAAGMTQLYCLATEEARNAGIQWFAFDTSEPPASNSGFELYLPFMKRTYSSSMKPLRPLGMMLFNPGGWVAPPGISGKKLGAVLVKQRKEWEDFGEADVIEWGDWHEIAAERSSIYHVSSGAPIRGEAWVTDSYSTTNWSGTPFKDLWSGSYSEAILLVDLTGY